MTSMRANIVTARTYNRQKEDGTLETWADTVDRVIEHQRWLWVRAKHAKLSTYNEKELMELRQLMLERKALVSGRTLWMGGTEIAKRREASQFNCSHMSVETINDVVDHIWLLLQGCGVGFTMKKGTLNGFTNPIKNVEVIRSTRTEKGGSDDNSETWDASTKTWTITIGDSGEAWAKAIGKLLAGKYPAQKLVFDLSQIRPGGGRLSQYGWISSGDAVLGVALPRIAEILSRRAGQLLSKMDILDIGNWLGVIQTGRRGAEIALIRYGDPEWQAFANAKKNYWLHDNAHRTQSNNSLVFYNKPTIKQLGSIFDIMLDSGGSEPGFINGEAATGRASYFKGVNPCAEILLGNKSFCNLVEIDIARFKDDPAGLIRAIQIMARANYRQTCVDLRDGVLQSAWHENNEFLRLCGVGLTGIVRRPDLTAFDYRALRNYANVGAYGAADELGLPAPKNVTTIKPSGTLSKIMDTTEGVHMPQGKYIFNNINFSTHDPIIGRLESAGYRVFANPDQPDAVLVTFPVKYDDLIFNMKNGKYVNTESALDQLERYSMLMRSYVDHNCSITVSYEDEEIPEIISWVDKNWDNYVGVSFIKKLDATKGAEDLGYTYLPQEVVTKERYKEYVARIEEFDPYTIMGAAGEIMDDDCAGGACPVR